MKKLKLANYTASIFMSLTIMSALYILFFVQEVTFFELKIIVVLALIGLSSLLSLIINISRSNSAFLNKTDNLEKLLLDIRDGTRTFYAERRKSPRLKLRDHINARLLTKDLEGLLIKVIDISHEGACIRVVKHLSPGEIIDFNMYLPLFPDPIYLKAKIVRTSKTEDDDQLFDFDTGFDVGVQYTEIKRNDREKLIETIRLLNDSYRRRMPG